MRSRLVLAEAALALTLTRLALHVLPFRWLAPAVCRPGLPEPVTGCTDLRAAGVGRAITRAAGRLPWHSTCLVRALAGRLMLARRGIPSVLCLGIAKEADAIRAHAWLLAGGEAVCGGRESPDYTPIAAFPTGRAS